MPQHIYLGKKNKNYIQDNKYIETRVTFQDLIINPKVNQIKLSDSQRDLNEEKVSEMIEEYKSNKHFLKCKNCIVMAVYNKIWYLVDGQHRLEMAKRYFNEYNQNDEFKFCWYICDNEDEMRKLFISLNKDSIGNKYYINTCDQTQFIIDNFIKLMSESYKQFFNKTDKDNSHIYSLKKIRDKLIDIRFFDNYDNALDCFKDIICKNNEFYNLCGYEKELNNNEELTGFYKEDKIRIKNKFIIPCKNSKFLDWLKTNNINDAYHNRMSPKKSIPPNVRLKVWEHTFKSNDSGICPISRCNNILKKAGKGGFQAGHVISEKNGGKTEYMNLRPICSECNRNMAHYNWEDYDSYSFRNLNFGN